MMEIMLDDSNDGFAHTCRICGGQHNLGEGLLHGVPAKGLGNLLVEQAFNRGWPGEEQMNLQKVYTALLTANLAAAERWYTKLLGRGPDYRPMDTMVQWELFDQGGLALSTSDEIAGQGVMFLIVDDVAAERGRLQRLGIVLGDDIEGDYSTLAQVRDPDGNLLTLATPPSPPYPSA